MCLQRCCCCLLMESTHACCLKEVAEIICVHLEQCLAVQRSRSFSNLLILLNVKANVYHKKLNTLLVLIKGGKKSCFQRLGFIFIPFRALCFNSGRGKKEKKERFLNLEIDLKAFGKTWLQLTLMKHLPTTSAEAVTFYCSFSLLILPRGWSLCQMKEVARRLFRQ